MSGPARDVVARAERTLAIMHRWGYAPTLETLAADLVGGPTTVDELADSVRDSSTFHIRDRFACLPGHEDLVEKSKRRVETNRLLNGRARKLADEFSGELARLCPFVECIALSGSVASGGYGPGDDIDFDLFVRDGTKYVVYALALLLGLRTSWRHRREFGLRKIICINVLWTRSQSDPFIRRDHDLAFELLHCKPLSGSARFREVVAANPWALDFFPQVALHGEAERPRPDPSRIARVLSRVADRPLVLALVESVCRQVTFAAYSLAHWFRRKDSATVARFELLRRVKYPYEVFQD